MAQLIGLMDMLQKENVLSATKSAKSMQWYYSGTVVHIFLFD